MSHNPAFHLLTGPAGEYYYFKNEIIERIRRQPGLEYDFIYFLPVRRAVRYFKEQLIDLADRQALADPPVYTFYQFMVELYQQLPGARKVISNTMRLFLVEEALKKNAANLQFFSPASIRRRGLIHKVDELLEELREYGYDAAGLAGSLQEEDEDDRVRIQDFSLLISGFEEALGQRLIDEAGAIQAVIARLDEAFWRKRFPRVDTVYLSGYGLFSRPMVEFFRRIQNVCSVKIKLDYLPENHEMFEHIDPAYEALRNLHPVEIQLGQPEAWERQLFRKSGAEFAQTEIKKDILIQPLNSRSEEVAFIANYVKRLHHHLKIPLHKIGITFPSLEQYAPLVHEIFPRYGLPDTGLPYNLSTGFQLSQSPLIRSFLLLLEVPLQGFEAKKLLQLLSSPFFNPPRAQRVEASAVKVIARELRLNYFHGKWGEDLQKYRELLQRQLTESAEDDDFDRQRCEELIETFAAAAPKLQTLLEGLKALEQKQPAADFREQYLSLLDRYGFLNWYKNESEALTPQEREREYRAFNRFIKVLDQFSWIMTNLHGERKLALKELHQYLSLLVSQATYNLREWANYGLQIMPRLEILSTEPQALIFGGMVEGEFPRPYTHDVFFNDEKRKQMGLAATEDLLAQDRYLLYQLLGSGAERLVFTYPRFQKEAAKVPSNFLNVLADQVKVRWRKSAPSPRFLQNRQDLLEQVARRIPPGIKPADQRNFRRWILLHQNEQPEKIALLPGWLQQVRSNAGKRRRDQFGEYEGMLGAYPEIIRELRERFGEGPFSITRLETYAFCPIRFFFQYLLRLEEEPEIEPGLTPLERGQLVHQTLFRFYRALKERRQERRPSEEAALLKQIAEEEFARLPFQGILFELEREKYFGSAQHPGVWAQFLKEEEESIGNLQFYPEYFEVAFGRAGRKSEQDPISIEEPLTLEREGKTVQITGKVDRVDLNEFGQALLLDYKTGSAISHVKEMLAGTALQLPVYAAALPKLLQRGQSEPAVEPVMLAIYQVKDEENCRRVAVAFDRTAGLNIKTGNNPAALPNKKIVDEEGRELTLGELIDRSEAQVFAGVEKIRQGEFRHTAYPDAPACESYCEFRRMCRKDVGKLLGAKGATRF